MKDFSHDFHINYNVKVNAPSCAKNFSHDFYINFYVKIKHHDQIIIKL